MKSRQYRQEIINKLDSLYESNPNEYWKLLDQLKSKDNSFQKMQVMYQKMNGMITLNI